MDLREAFWPLLGNWTGVERLGPTQHGAGDDRASSWTCRPGGAAGLPPGRPTDGSELTGHGVFLVDPVTTTLLWWFFDSAGVPPTPLRGRWSDDAPGPRRGR